MTSAEPERVPFPSRYNGEVQSFLAELVGWIRSDPIRWLFANVPGGWPKPDAELYDSDDPVAAIRALDSLCDWRTHGTNWDTRNDRERQEIEEAFADLRG